VIAGMQENVHGHERHFEGAAPRWFTALYVICWIALAVLVAWRVMSR
jgi:hypothetical protein